MRQVVYTLAGVMLVATMAMPSAALAGAGNFSIVNATGADISSMAIRRVGTATWKPLAATPTAGEAASAPFSDPDCAFDLRATLAGGATVTWTGVNLCDVKLVTLRRNAGGLAWVDYD